MVNKFPPNELPPSGLDEIANLANNARLIYEPENSPIRPPNIPGVIASASLSLSLDIADAGIIVLIRFPFSDGNSELGLEVK